MSHYDPNTVLHFWFSIATPEQWFSKNEAFDNELRHRFLDLSLAVASGECADWRKTIKGRVAEIIVLDQFSRNIWRDQPQAFSQDGMALVLAQETIVLPDFEQLDKDYKRFVLMPFMHSESKKIHEDALSLFASLNDETLLGYELRHKVIIDRFGRYPHRNQILGRPSTPEELVFLTEPNSSF